MEVQDGREGGVTGPAPGDGRGGATSLSQPAGLPHNRVQWRRKDGAARPRREWRWGPVHLNGARGGAPATIRVWPGRPGRAGGRAQTDERGAGVCRGRVRRRRAQGSSVLPLRSPRLLALPSALPLCFACDFSPPPAPAFVGSPPLPALLSSPPFVSPSLPRPALPAFFLLFLSVVAWSAYVRVLVPSCRVPGLPLEVLAVSSFVVLSQVPGYGASSAVPVDGIALCKTLSWRLGRRTSREGC